MNERIAPEHVNNAPTTTVGDNSPQAHASIQDRAGLYIAIVALILAVLAIGLVIMMPIVIEAKVQAGVAQAKADMQQQAEEAKATAEAGRQHARVALDKVEDFRAKFAEKGININLDGH
jgi:uncharacterized protein HemX